ncbi:YdgH/BhsA/McbA-like domain containing protein [Acinetobacter baumannii]|uniref:YdgH/BhsA/McbA-like domain containing protein n=1 Tax=Acinetobacter baumannii TaxID=470 RepID=UPI00387E284A
MRAQIVSILISSWSPYHLSHQGNNAPYRTKLLKEYDHENHQNFRSSTLDRAEAKIAAQAAEQGASYKITSAQFNNRVHMTAELTK